MHPNGCNEAENEVAMGQRMWRFQNPSYPGAQLQSIFTKDENGLNSSTFAAESENNLVGEFSCAGADTYSVGEGRHDWRGAIAAFR